MLRARLLATALLIALTVAGVAMPTLHATAALADTPTPIPGYDYSFTLSSGHQVRVVREITFGKIAVTLAILALFILVLIYILYRVIERWNLDRAQARKARRQ